MKRRGFFRTLLGGAAAALGLQRCTVDPIPLLAAEATPRPDLAEIAAAACGKCGDMGRIRWYICSPAIGARAAASYIPDEGPERELHYCLCPFCPTLKPFERNLRLAFYKKFREVHKPPQYLISSRATLIAYAEEVGDVVMAKYVRERPHFVAIKAARWGGLTWYEVPQVTFGRFVCGFTPPPSTYGGA